ncbi:unnamed protein product [Bursaphelenchus okinawaensis]|uniref:Uncharacterized protein n=1 Tax=Bursaphelenchus okinawaensis TaxID=465554 RepID=A0A811L2S8_9BILA|nr:unnamed protein product [Bursaphelenchus okinawaensis]CAG9115563.1 unnamed protein product [Bursaphelenchus okinawaensis]
MKYLLMGMSIIYEKTNHQSFASGIIASEIKRYRRYIGTSGSFKGDGGGSVWSEKGCLLGMQIEVENLKHTVDQRKRPASPASGGRCAIIAIEDIIANIQDLIMFGKPAPVFDALCGDC